MNYHVQSVIDFFRGLIFEWDNPADDPVGNLARGYSQSLDCHDNLLIESNRKYLLMASAGNFYLVSRNKLWKAKLNEQDLELYKKRGKRAFFIIERNHVKYGEQVAAPNP